MSKRLTKSLEEKYGAKGKKGRDGELFFKKFYERKGYILYDKNDNVFAQVSGVDFIIKTPDEAYTVDVKCNVKYPSEIAVEINNNGWLFNPKKISTFISHVSPENGMLLTYRRSRMQKFIEDNYWDARGDVIFVPISELTFAKVEITDKER